MKLIKGLLAPRIVRFILPRQTFVSPLEETRNDDLTVFATKRKQTTAYEVWSTLTGNLLPCDGSRGQDFAL